MKDLLPRIRAVLAAPAPRPYRRAPWRSPRERAARLALAAGLIAAAWSAVAWAVWPISADAVVRTLVATVGYVLVGHLLRPRPELDEALRVGDEYDDLYQLNADIRRALRVVQFLVAPGTFVASAALDVASRRAPVRWRP